MRGGRKKVGDESSSSVFHTPPLPGLLRRAFSPLPPPVVVAHCVVDSGRNARKKQDDLTAASFHYFAVLHSQIADREKG